MAAAREADNHLTMLELWQDDGRRRCRVVILSPHTKTQLALISSRLFLAVDLKRSGFLQSGMGSIQFLWRPVGMQSISAARTACFSSRLSLARAFCIMAACESDPSGF